jgi:thiol-disulfide isomerase/thioredoxin
MKLNLTLSAVVLVGAIASALMASAWGWGAPEQLTSATESRHAVAANSLEGASSWLNSNGLSMAGLRGKVVVVNFWTYSCINSLRQLPHLRAWAEKYREKGLVVVGVHAPEFGFEHVTDNVRRATTDLKLGYPVAIDNDHAIWRAFGNQYWPALYIVDAHGRVRHHKFGEGDYAQLEKVIQDLLTEAGARDVGHELAPVDGRGAEAEADWAHIASEETYVGHQRAERFSSPGGAVSNRARDYAPPPQLRLNQWALSGNWTMGNEATVLNNSGGRIVYRFHARDLHLVMAPGPQGRPVRFRVRIDGKEPDAARGVDIDRQGSGIVTEPRMYQLVRQPKPVVDREFEIEFLDPGVQTFAFTFG